MTKEIAAFYVLGRIKNVLPRLAVDPSLFEDTQKTKRMFQVLEKNKVVSAIEDREEEDRQNQRIAKIFKEHREKNA